MVGGELHGDPAREISAVRTLASAGPGDLSFLTGGRFAAEARSSRAGALLVRRLLDGIDADQVVVRDPKLAVAKVLELFHPPAAVEPGIHPTAVIGEGATVDPAAQLGPYCVIGAGARIGARAVVHAHVVVGPECEVGEGATLHPHVVLYRGVRLAAGVVVHAGSVLGADGFGYADEGGRPRKVPHVGGVEVGSEVEIGALSAVDRGMLDDTRVGAESKIDNLVQVGHNSRIGRGVRISGMSGLSGSVEVGDGAVLGGQVGVADHASIGARTMVAGQSMVMSQTEPGSILAGSPAAPIGQWRRQQALLRRLGEIWRRLRALEKHAGLGPDGEGEEPD